MSLGIAEMETSTSKPEAQQQRGCPCRAQGSGIPVGPMGQESSLSLDRHQAPHKEGKAGPQQGQSQSPTKILLWRGCQSTNLTNSKTRLVLISGNLMEKAQSSCPLHSQGAVAAPHFQLQFLSPQLEQRAHLYLGRVLSRSTSSSWSSQLFLWDNDFHSSISCKAPGTLPAHRQEEKWGSDDGKELPQPRGGERG